MDSKENRSKTSRKIRGQSMTEYILLVGLIALACVAVIKIFGGEIKGGFQKAAKEVRSATNP